jgi:hypothetical protein
MTEITKSLLALQDTMLNALTSNKSLAETMYMLSAEVERLAPEVHCCIIRLDGSLCAHSLPPACRIITMPRWKGMPLVRMLVPVVCR